MAIAAGEGAEGTTDVANRVAVVTNKTNTVLHLIQSTNESAGKLEEEILKFKL